MASSGSSAGKATRNTIYKEYGGNQGFMHSYGLKMSNDDHVQEAKAIANEMLKQDANSKASATSTAATTSKS